MTRSRLWLALAVLSAVLLVTSTSGFSMASMDRGVSISVADDHHAYISIWDPGAQGDHSNPLDYHRENPVHGRETVPVLIVKNRLRQDVTVSVSNDDGNSITVDGGPTTVESRSAVRLDATVDCQGHHGLTATVPLTLHADGDRMTATIHHDATIVCAGSQGNETATPTPTPST